MNGRESFSILLNGVFMSAPHTHSIYSIVTISFFSRSLSSVPCTFAPNSIRKKISFNWIAATKEKKRKKEEMEIHSRTMSEMCRVAGGCETIGATTSPSPSVTKIKVPIYMRWSWIRVGKNKWFFVVEISLFRFRGIHLTWSLLWLHRIIASIEMRCCVCDWFIKINKISILTSYKIAMKICNLLIKYIWAFAWSLAMDESLFVHRATNVIWWWRRGEEENAVVLFVCLLRMKLKMHFFFLYLCSSCCLFHHQMHTIIIIEYWLEVRAVEHSFHLQFTHLIESRIDKVINSVGTLSIAIKENEIQCVWRRLQWLIFSLSFFLRLFWCDVRLLWRSGTKEERGNAFLERAFDYYFREMQT